MGFYCVEEVEGKITVGTYEYIVTEDPTDAPVVTDAPTDAPVVTDAPTAAPTDAPVVGGTGITVDGVVYDVKVGDTVTYTVDLTAARLFENIQAIVTFDPEKLDLQLITSDDPDVADWEVQGPEYCKNLDGVIFNAGIPGTVKFNASKVAGYNFKTEANLITLTFVVKDASASEIALTIEEMTIKGGEESYFANGEAVITDGITVVEKLDVPVVEDPTEAPTQEPTAAPTDAPVVPTAAPTDAPVVPTAAPTDAPVVPTAAPTDAPVEPTKAPTAVVDPTSGSDVPASSTTGGTGAPNTGAAAYIYVVVAVLAMAACAVVVLRKRVNG